MDTQELNRTTMTNFAQPPFVLTDVAQMASSQGVLIQPKSEQEVMQAFERTLKQTECIINYQHHRVLQGGIEIDLFVVSSLAVDLLTKNAQQQIAPSPAGTTDARSVLAPTHKPSEEAQKCRQTIKKAINYIFQHKRFRKNSVMAESPLQTLDIVCEARQAWMGKRGLGTIPTKHDNALVLRKFLTKSLDDNLCPEPGKATPENLCKSAIRDEWVEYLILRWQYIDGFQRKEVMRMLQKHHYDVTDGSMYTRRVQAARKRLASLIWQKEMQAQKALKS
ncbi:MAG: hypothetical protein ACPGWR_16190 [Ardenticatenaceae bacterium]